MASTTSSDAKIDNLVRVMERINLSLRTPPRENQANLKNKNRNPNFKTDPPQNRPRDNDQQIRPPFQDNYVDEEGRSLKNL